MGEEKRLTQQTRYWLLKCGLRHDTGNFYTHASARANLVVKPDIPGVGEPQRKGARYFVGQLYTLCYTVFSVLGAGAREDNGEFQVRTIDRKIDR